MYSSSKFILWLNSWKKSWKTGTSIKFFYWEVLFPKLLREVYPWFAKKKWHPYRTTRIPTTRKGAIVGRIKFMNLNPVTEWKGALCPHPILLTTACLSVPFITQLFFLPVPSVALLRFGDYHFTHLPRGNRFISLLYYSFGVTPNNVAPSAMHWPTGNGNGVQ